MTTTIIRVVYVHFTICCTVVKSSHLEHTDSMLLLIPIYSSSLFLVQRLHIQSGGFACDSANLSPHSTVKVLRAYTVI